MSLEHDSNTPASRPIFAPAEVAALGIRVKPADFARLCGVSRQAVFQWIRAGKISLLPGRLIDPGKAIRELLANGDPNRMRAWLFRHADDVAPLRERIAGLETELGQARRRIAHLDALLREGERIEDTFIKRIVGTAPALRAADDEQFGQIIERLHGEAIAAAGGFSEGPPRKAGAEMEADPLAMSAEATPSAPEKKTERGSGLSDG